MRTKTIPQKTGTVFPSHKVRRSCTAACEPQYTPNIFALLLIALLTFVTLYAATVTLVGATGPGCAADPEWLGYCNDIEKV